MAIKAPPMNTGKQARDVKPNKSFLSEALSAKTRELVQTEDGRYITVGQMMAERLANIAMFASSNTDAIAAQKLIYERLQGKAAVAKDEDVKPMPKVVFTLTSDGLDKVNEAKDKTIIEAADVEDNGEAPIIAEIDGKFYVG